MEVSGSSPAVEELVRRAAAAEGFTEHIDDAVADAQRSLDALRAEGILDTAATRAAEYPVLLPSEDGERLLVGSADLVARWNGTTQLIDFKTDAPAPLEEHPEYVEQVRLYARGLVEAGIAERSALRAGLLFTADGTIRWVDLK